MLITLPFVLPLAVKLARDPVWRDRGVTPFIIADLILLGLLTLFPQIASWVP